LHTVIEGTGRAAVILSADLQITYASRLAAVWMKEYFGGSHGGALPEQLDSWLREQLARLQIVDDVAAPSGPLRLEGETGTIVIRLASLPNGWLLSLEKEAPRLQIRALQLLPITKREAEVLFHVANGKTNPEIAVILGVSRLTVKKHLEHIFQSLSVETRTAAAAVALQLASDVPR
jgi:DNA-binding CsgD family transcriptional regulator